VPPEEAVIPDSVARPPVALSAHFPSGEATEAAEAAALSRVARGLSGSEILKVAAEVRARQAAGEPLCNLTVGDFAPSEFRIPAALESAIVRQLAAGQTNYPPSDGLPELRREVARFYERALRLTYPIEAILIAGGARPLIYATFRALLDPGEKVVVPVPSWNNESYAHLVGAEVVPVVASRASNFLPTAATLDPHLRDARLVVINSPLNPAGTVLSEEEVRAIANLLVEENRRRKSIGARALFLLWDQVYWMLTFGGAKHVTPPEVVPESAAWTILVDSISKSFAATGLRVGWAAAPPYVRRRMADILAHVGAWAPRPEQAATAELLADDGAVAAFHATMIAAVRRRLDRLHEGFEEMARAGLPVEVVPPQGAIYLSVRFALDGRRLDGDPARPPIRSNEEIRRLLLAEAGFAVVTFQAFGLREESGWMRLSVGALALAEIEAGLPRVRALLERCR
jgi:aspartate aminotransferase